MANYGQADVKILFSRSSATAASSAAADAAYPSVYADTLRPPSSAGGTSVTRSVPAPTGESVTTPGAAGGWKAVVANAGVVYWYARDDAARWPPASGQRNSRCFRSSTRARNRLAQESVPAGARASFRSRRRCRRRRRRCWQRCCRGHHCHSKRQQSSRRAVSLSPSLTGQLPRLGRPAARRSWAVMAVTVPAAWEQ